MLLTPALPCAGTGVNDSFHDAAGRPLINLTRFPDMKAMNTEAHGKGVAMGWYQNNCGCNEAAQFGSIGGHVRQDAEATAELLFDSIKVDGCGPSQNISEWTEELNATGRPILLEVPALSRAAAALILFTAIHSREIVSAVESIC